MAGSMASNRLVDRAKAAATRSAAETQMESHQRRYKADLEQEIGPTSFGRAAETDDGNGSFLQVMTQPAMILILAIITFALTFIVLMWREGRLDNLFPARQAPAIERDPKAWMLGRNADGVVEDTAPPNDAIGNSASALPESPISSDIKSEKASEETSGPGNTAEVAE